jgi:hypothetical protein
VAIRLPMIIGLEVAHRAVQVMWFEIGKSDTEFRHGTNLFLSWKADRKAA